MKYSDRAEYCKNTLAKKLLFLLDTKQTNLALSADVQKCDQLLALADLVGPEICVLKTHIDILEDFTPDLTRELRKLADKHQFLIFEDRKFADIGNTVKNQYAKGIYQIVEWADIVNAHSLPGPGIIQGLAEEGLKRERALLLLAEMSSQNNLLDPIYAEKTLEMAEQFPEFVIGFIAQRKLNTADQWIYMTPGVQRAAAGDNLGQQYISPEQAIQNGADIIIVGRGILHAKDPLAEAKYYREAGWKAYCERSK